MATCSEVIQSAYRRSGVLAAGTNMNATQSATGLERLKGMYLKMLGDALFGQLNDYFADADYTAKEMDRVYNDGGSNTITVPDTVTDADTGLERAPLDGAVIVVIDPFASPFDVSIKLYDAHYGWQEVNGLVTSNPAPLSGRYEEGIKNMLAVLIADENGYPISALLAANAARARLSIGARYDQKRPAVQHVFY